MFFQIEGEIFNKCVSDLLMYMYVLLKKGTVMLKVSPFQERSVTQVMCAMVERILEHPMMEQQEDLVLKGRSALQALLNLILVVLEHTVRALVEQATKTVSCVILDTSVLRSN